MRPERRRAGMRAPHTRRSSHRRRRSRTRLEAMCAASSPSSPAPRRETMWCTECSSQWTSRARRLRARGADLEARTADGRDVRAGRWIVRRDEANGGELITVIAGGEQHADPRGIGEHEDVVVRGTIACAVEDIACVITPRVGDHLREVPIDDPPQAVQQSVLAVLRADVEDGRAGRHRVHGLEVERLLAEPAVGTARLDVVV